VTELFGPFAEPSHELRKQELIENRIALWDVLSSGNRVGSLDSRIKLSTAVPNDFRTFFHAHNHVELICFNGGMAAKIYERKVLSDLFVDMRQISRRVLPSTRPANTTTRFEQKLSSWRALKRGDIP
jgi:hypoxanthine-DNA glycosylase